MIYNQNSLDLINKQRQFLKDNHPDLFMKGRELEELFSEYNFMIFDLPKFELDDEPLFHEIWREKHINCGRVRTDIASPYDVDSTPRFRSLDIIENLPNRKRIWQTNYHDLSDKFPKFYQQMYDFLPFSKINYVRLWQSINHITPHRDDSWWYFNFPTEIRIMIYDENETGTLKIVPELAPTDLHYVNLPAETNSFGWNNLRCLHSSDKKDKEKILACITGNFDLDKLHTLFAKSVDKFDNDKNKTKNDPYNDLIIK